MVRVRFSTSEIDFFSCRTGRFLQRDIIGYVDGLNLYEAFGGTPENYDDIFGLSSTRKDGFFCLLKKLKDNFDKLTQSYHYNFMNGSVLLEDRSERQRKFLEYILRQRDRSNRTELYMVKTRLIPAIDYLLNNYNSSEIKIVPIEHSINIGSFIDIINPQPKWYLPTVWHLIPRMYISSKRFWAKYNDIVIEDFIHEPQHDLAKRWFGHNSSATEKKLFGLKDWTDIYNFSIAYLIGLFKRSQSTKNTCNQCPNKNKKINNLWDQMQCECGIQYRPSSSNLR